MNKYKALTIVTDPEKKGTPEYCDAAMTLFKYRRTEFLRAIEDHLKISSRLLSEDEEEDLRSILALLRKYTQ